MCVGLSSGTATLLASNDSLERSVRDEDTCACQCHRHLPAFREDLHICVDDIHGKYPIFLLFSSIVVVLRAAGRWRIYSHCYYYLQ